MKENVKILIIGFLLGAIITTGICYIYIKLNSSNCSSQTMQMPGGNPPEKPDSENPFEMQKNN